MRAPTALARNLLRAVLLAMLVLGLMVRPMLNQMGDLHAAEHVLQAHAGAQVHDDDHGHHHFDLGQIPGSDHVKGAHLLMHSADGSSSATVWTVPVVLMGLPPTDSLPASPLGAAPVFPPDSVFRPPIV